MATTIYMIYDDEEELDVAFPTQRDAKRYRTDNKMPRGTEIRSIVLADLPRRELLCALFNQEGYEAKPVKRSR